MLRGDSSRDRLELGARLLNRDALFYLADAIEKEIAARIVFLLDLERHPDVADFREAPSFGHDADHGDLFAVDRNDLADHAFVAGEMFLPDLVANESNGRCVQLVFIRPKE